MTTIQGRGGRYLGFAFALLLAALGAGSCGGEESDTDDDLIHEAVVNVPIERCGDLAAQQTAAPLADEAGGCLQAAAKKCIPAGKSCRIGKGDCCAPSICFCGPGAKKCTCS